MNIDGHAWVFGDDINTDVIHAPAFFSHDDEHVKRGLFHGYDPEMQARVQPGDVLVGGRNFGCGSSRETSIRSLLLNRIGAILAVDFARIFFRNATNNGLPCLCFADPADSTLIAAGARLRVDLARSVVTVNGEYELALVPPGAFVRRLWQCGGLMALLDQERDREVLA
ncbi:aconitate hydratase [Haliangium ochraceum]|uniref:Aconitate hydratase domain protein n=1 Tax=Haliangium ochraceum (strain DSM 14365 / JCM 11303 / SMP-2) TaxID=502025 RepID=D0LNS0_HALO1|nr:aconitate hydratase [Haliangium ochraceum]ACY16975.1 aconitate hydratase domain protein [Haliangium ochraceum DSM 14365]